MIEFEEMLCLIIMAVIIMNTVLCRTTKRTRSCVIKPIVMKPKKDDDRPHY